MQAIMGMYRYWLHQRKASNRRGLAHGNSCPSCSYVPFHNKQLLFLHAMVHIITTEVPTSRQIMSSDILFGPHRMIHRKYAMFYALGARKKRGARRHLHAHRNPQKVVYAGMRIGTVNCRSSGVQARVKRKSDYSTLNSPLVSMGH